METRKLVIGCLALGLLAWGGAWTLAAPKGAAPAREVEEGGHDADEDVIDFDRLPEPVHAAALKLVGAAGEQAIKKAIKEEHDDVAVYEIEYTAEGSDCTAVFSTLGELMELEKGVKEAALPAVVLASLKKDYPKATFKDPNLVQKFYYEIEVVVDGKSHEVKVDAAGNIEDELKDEDREPENGKDDDDDD